MGAARVVISLAALGIAAGAYLAVATMPSFAPYEQRPRTAPPILPAPTLDPGQDSAFAQGPGYALPPAYDSSDESYDPADDGYGSSNDGYDLLPQPPRESDVPRFAYGPQRGTVILELPRWVDDGGEWMELGRRALREWSGRAREFEERQFAERQSEERRERYGSRHPDADERYTDRRGARDDGPYGYVPRYERGGEEQGYTRPESPYMQAPLRDAAPGGVERQAPSSGNTLPDAAAQAAQRARDAARDVRAAESLNP
jgi:hypothetical protein